MYPYGVTKNAKQRYCTQRLQGVSEDTAQEFPCGKCISCQMDRSKEWATRAVHEAQTNEINCFITLTYSNEHLPENGSLEPSHLKQFIKNLRKSLPGKKIKYLASGEYGSEENTHRPHYHICLFGWDPPDKKYLFTNKHGDPVYTSDSLLKRWNNKGHITVGELNYRTAAYTARYTLKKVQEYGNYSPDVEIIDKETGETNYEPVLWKKKAIMDGKHQEFIRMSKGIGKEWLKKYRTDTYKDYVYVNRKKHKIPRYYDKENEKVDPERLEATKEKRKKAAIESKNKPRPSNESRDLVKRNKLKLLKRKI
jgi:hypothetical protein